MDEVVHSELSNMSTFTGNEQMTKWRTNSENPCLLHADAVRSAL